MRRVWNWNEIQRYHDEGHGFVECRRKFGFSYDAWLKAIGRGALRIRPSLFADRRRKYDWSAVQAYYDEGHSYRECRQKFGFANASWTKAVQRGEVVPRPRAKNLETVLRSKASRHWKKRKLVREGILDYRCSMCGIAEWLGRPLAIQIDHINGVRDDWRIENLRMLCPNCHSQTPTFAGRNMKRTPRSLQDQQRTV
jgi:5-methylcytosine-specific restriction endonuclease McrA